ncbi:hypothetical protein BY457_12324 [Marinilabilia salmonicolor]|jgi:hypothetical protein|nr:hypothetical protein BY457_12324 [Marinilabilia salmonicolor]
MEPAWLEFAHELCDYPGHAHFNSLSYFTGVCSQKGRSRFFINGIVAGLRRAF